ncbi:DUF805 domain-containing protein [Chelativorans sp. Marseille-P2723]|uniref:DUF805 domain-containing protein n=1 Tax=Chelativorans sp. Marseille-P2723 TaxID=2709133 RepID=UPI00156F3A7F|nr:DUF805 domain-containing protein [Chelativorans sp. Marseille-P2723]
MDIKTFIWLFFGLSGRISRLVYFLANVFAGLFPLFAIYRLSLIPEGDSAASGWLLFFWFFAIVGLWSQLALGVKRLHDFDKPGILAAALFVPVFAFFVLVILCLYPGDSGPNSYGERTNAPK